MSKPTRFEIGNSSNRPAPFSARLDKKTGCRVLCGRPDCGTELARLTIDYEALINVDALPSWARLQALESLTRPPCLRFEPGWEFDPAKDALAITKHVAARLRRDDALAHGNPGVSHHLARETRERLASRRTFQNRRGDSRGDLTGGIYNSRKWVHMKSLSPFLDDDVVQKVECPKCHGISRIDDAFRETVRKRQRELQHEMLGERDLDALIRQAQDEEDQELTKIRERYSLEGPRVP